MPGISHHSLCKDSLRAFGASLKAGHYRSAQLYFTTIFSYQFRNLGIEADNILKQLEGLLPLHRERIGAVVPEGFGRPPIDGRYPH